MGRLIKKLTEYGESAFYPYHMPGHKRNTFGSMPKEWTGVDITEIEGFDNLHQPEAILKELQEEAAAAYGAEESFYLVNGSTSGILSAVSAAVPFGGELLISRNCHKSVYHAAYLRHLQMDYIYPKTNGFDICEAVTARQVEAALLRYPNAAAVLVVSPTYEGRIADIEAIAKIVHGKGIPLIVDEAHGAHLGFSQKFAKNSCRLGADLVINSVHKTLPAMTQTALLHCGGNLIDREQLRRFLHIYQSSSPSYVLMSSIEEAVETACSQLEIFERFARQWEELLQKLSACRNLKFLPSDPEECIQKKHDIGKLVISVKGTGLSGQRLYDILLNRYQLQMEMACESYVLAMFTIGDTAEGYERLGRALMEIDEELDAGGTNADGKIQGSLPWRPEVILPFYEAWDETREYVGLEEAKNQIAGDFLNLYPPGTPIAVPGERISEEMIQMIKRCLEDGLTLQGVNCEGKVAVLQQGGVWER